MGFPKGGPLVEKLHFFTDVQGADLCRAWKTLYRRHGVPAQIGVEFVGLEPGGAGVWQAHVRNHRTGSNGVIRARHVVLALGAGSPRRLDVPGEAGRLAHRLAAPTERRQAGLVSAARLPSGGVAISPQGAAATTRR